MKQLGNFVKRYGMLALFFLFVVDKEVARGRSIP